MTTTNDTDVLPHIGDGSLDGVRMGLRDLLSLPRIGERPSGRYRLWGAEHAVDPTATTAIGASAPKPPPGLWMAAFHEGDKVLATHSRVGLDSQSVARLLF